MSKKEYHWEPGQPPPLIHVHSIRKHEVLSGYLMRYLKVLNAIPNIDVFRLTLVDGFAGGGLYRHEQSHQEVRGSPLIFLEATQQAAKEINAQRKKPFSLDAHYFFVEHNPQVLAVLRQTLLAHGYDSLLEQERIQLLQGEFTKHASQIIHFIKNKGRKGRAIFLLDQYGYKDVPFTLLQQIFHSLPEAEVILTFAVDALSDFLSDNTQSQHLLTRLGITHRIDLNSITATRGTSDRRAVIQRIFSSIIHSESGARYYTPFFISSRESNRDYWLVHLSNHARARDEMALLHWELHNHFSHNGGPGLNMLGYDPDKDPVVTGQSLFDDFNFDEQARLRSISSLREQLPRLIIKSPDGISFKTLLETTCNSTPASGNIYREALDDLLANEDIAIIHPESGVRRRKGTSITNEDVIQLPRQRTFFLPTPRKKD